MIEELKMKQNIPNMDDEEEYAQEERTISREAIKRQIEKSKALRSLIDARNMNESGSEAQS